MPQGYNQPNPDCGTLYRMNDLFSTTNKWDEKEEEEEKKQKEEKEEKGKHWMLFGSWLKQKNCKTFGDNWINLSRYWVLHDIKK